MLWLATTAALALVLPTTWLQKNVINTEGYAALAQKAAGDRDLQSAMAGELTARAMALIAQHGAEHYPVDSTRVHDAIAEFTASRAFPPVFAQANRSAHDWLFSEPQPGQASDQWVIDVAPMLNDSSVQQILTEYGVKVPPKLTVPVAVSPPPSLRQGRLSRVTTWGPWVSVGAAAAAAFSGLLLLMVARRRGKALTSIGISALLVGAAGWAAIEVGSRRATDALNRTTGDIRRVGEVMVAQAEASMHLWLNATLVAGAALVVLGVVCAVWGGMGRSG